MNNMASKRWREAWIDLCELKEVLPYFIPYRAGQQKKQKPYRKHVARIDTGGEKE